MIIIVARHGKTDLNEAKIVCGISDKAVLLEEGKKHAEKLAEIFSSYGFDAIFSSPFKRTFETALPISKLANLPIQTDERLAEMNFGLIEETSHEENKEHFQKRQLDLSYRFPEGENYLDVLARVDDFLTELNKKKLDKVLVVAHGGANRALIARLLKQDLTNPENLTRIFVGNEVVYELDSILGTCSWLNTLTGERGKGIKFSD